MNDIEADIEKCPIFEWFPGVLWEIHETNGIHIVFKAKDKSPWFRISRRDGWLIMSMSKENLTDSDALDYDGKAREIECEEDVHRTMGARFDNHLN